MARMGCLPLPGGNRDAGLPQTGTRVPGFIMHNNHQTDIDIIIVIPVYNHAKTLRDTVIRALEVNDEVMVVDDGSTDCGIETLAGLDVHILHHSFNRGKGAAILTAARACRQLGMTHMVTIDADGQHDPNDSRRFHTVIWNDRNAIVIGKRDFQTTRIPGISRFGRYFSNFWVRVQTGQSIGDTQSGFRAYPLVVLEKLRLRETRFAFEVEVLVKAAWAGVTLHEVDISVYYPPAQQRVSHFSLFKDNLRITLLNTRLTLRSLSPVPHRQIFDLHGRNEKLSVRHPIRLLKALLAENNSSGQVVAAGALGVFLGTLPLIGFHSIVILFGAGFFRLNKITALTASQLCMPPFVPALCIETGYFLRHGTFLTELSMTTLGSQGLERCYEWLIGSLILAPVLSAVVAGIIYVMAFFIKMAGHESD